VERGKRKGRTGGKALWDRKVSKEYTTSAWKRGPKGEGLGVFLINLLETEVVIEVKNELGAKKPFPKMQWTLGRKEAGMTETMGEQKEGFQGVLAGSIGRGESMYKGPKALDKLKVRAGPRKNPKERENWRTGDLSVSCKEGSLLLSNGELRRNGKLEKKRGSEDPKRTSTSEKCP